LNNRFQELQLYTNTLDWFFIFVCQFYARPSPLYFLKVSKHKDLIVISKFGTQHGDPLGGMLFALVHLHVLCPTVAIHLTCVFRSLVDDTHIVGRASNMVPIFLRLQEEFGALGLSMKPLKCVAWYS
jgi:hypothetical protein